MMQEPNHGSLSSSTYAQLLAYRDNEELNFNRGWVGVNYSPINAADNQYQTYASHTANGYIACMISSTAGNTFSYEICAHFEVIGAGVSDGTASPTDPMGTAAVLNSVQGVPVSGHPASDSVLNRAAGQAYRVVTDELGRLSGVALNAAARGVDAAASGVAYAATLGAFYRRATSNHNSGGYRIEV